MTNSKPTAISDIDRDALRRSLARSSSEAVKIPEHKFLKLLAKRTKSAREALEALFQKSVEYIAYVHRMKKIVFSSHSALCTCDFCEFGKQCKRYQSMVWRWVDKFRRAINRRDLFRGVPVNLVARKIVLTGC